MLIAAVAALLDRELRTLRREVEAYPDDGAIWKAVPGISNPAGTLVLHLTGNLQHYVGALLGATGYVRDRAAEFARRDVPRSELLGQIEAARSAVRKGLSGIGDRQLAAEFPEPVGGVRLATGQYLLHLTTHLAYHLGQIDYHRRIVTGSATSVSPVRAAELSTARSPGSA
ncbi:MAG: DinB family protein [Gemmatimonadales bacterium]